MDNKDLIQERISSLIDGELAGVHTPAILSALSGPTEQAAWDMYHQIGDVLRSDDMALSMSPGFMHSLSARLDAEPTIIAPAVINAAVQKAEQSFASTFAKRFAMPGLAVAASVAVLIFVSSPQVLVATKDTPQNSTSVVVQASPGKPASRQELVTAVATNHQEGVILRDPQIDQYLSAHQRFSPSAYSIAQYARSASFASDSGK